MWGQELTKLVRLSGHTDTPVLTGLACNRGGAGDTAQGSKVFFQLGLRASETRSLAAGSATADVPVPTGTCS